MITQAEKRRIIAAKKERALRAANATKLDNPPAILRAEARSQKWNMPDPSLYANQLELLRRVPSVLTAVDMVAKSVSVAELEVYNYNGDKKTDIENHPLEQLFRQPNPLNSASEFWTATVTNRLLTGNCYWWLNKISESAKPTEMWIIAPQDIIPVPDENLYIKGYAYDPGDGQIIPLETWEVLHVKRYNPFNPFVGLSLVESLAVTALGDIEAREWLTRFYGAHDGQPSALFAFAEMINNTDWATLKNDFARASEKKQAIMLRGVGKGGVEWMKSGTTPADNSFLDGLLSNQETVFNAISPGLSSMLAVNSNEANARVGEAIFKNYTVWAMLTEFSSKMNQKNGLVSLYGDSIVAEFEDVRVQDKAMELQEMAQYEKTHTIDEVRREYYNEPPIGDERGSLFVVEIGAAMTIAPDNQPSEAITQTVADTSIEEARPEDTNDEPVKSDLEIDLDKWRRKASKRIGESVPFESDFIPHAVKKSVLVELEKCETKDDVKAVFDRALDFQQVEYKDVSGFEKLLEQAIKAMNAEEKPAPQQPTIVNLTIPAKADMTPQEVAQAFAAALSNVPAPQVTVTNDVQPAQVINQQGDTIVNVPEQAAPQVQVDVNLDQVTRMTTEHKRGADGKVYRSETELE